MGIGRSAAKVGLTEPVANVRLRDPFTKAKRNVEIKDESLRESLELLRSILPQKARRTALEESAQEIARIVSADVVQDALRKSGKTLREVQEATGLEPSMISRIATGHHKNGPHLWSLIAIARALNQKLTITID